MAVEDDAECRRKLDEQRNKGQRELRLSFASKEVQENLVESLPHQLQQVERKRNDLMLEHQRVQKRSQKIYSIQDQRKYVERDLGGKRKNVENLTRNWVEGRALHTAVGQSRQKTQWQMRKWKQNFRDCMLEKKEEVVMHRRQEIAAWRRWWNRFSPWKRTRRGLSSMLCVKKSSRDFETFVPPAQMPGREGRRDSENEQEQGRTSQQLVLPTPDGINQGAPATNLELDLHRLRGVPGESGSAGRSSKQGDRKRGPSRSPGRHPMVESYTEALEHCKIRTPRVSGRRVGCHNQGKSG